MSTSLFKIVTDVPDVTLASDIYETILSIPLLFTSMILSLIAFTVRSEIVVPVN